MIKVGDFVKIVKVIEVFENNRDAFKKSVFGSVRRVASIVASPYYVGHCYKLEFDFESNPFVYLFHVAELELVECGTTMPDLGRLVRLMDGSIIQVERIQSITVSDKNGKTGLVASVLTLEECETFERALAAAAEKKRAEEKEALLKQHERTFAAAKKALDDLADITAKLSLY